ncbi:MAG: signal peptide peptidase SppA [Nitrospirae bacterium]|nr:signal peptide peptidase SppA [Nitrospirota bacterium]
MTVSRKSPLGDKVALVRVTGVILDSSDVIEELKEHSKDSSVKAIVLRIDSPGGAVAPSQEIYEEIKKIKEKKKVIVSMGTVAASGGYYISAPADRIVANAGTLTGSIGVIMEIPNISGLMQKIGVETQVIKSGAHKDIASIFKSLKPEEKEILQTVLDDVHDQFIQAVSEGRGIKFEQIKKLADGRIFTGRMAKEVGLVDEIGNLQDAIMLAGELTGIKGEPQVVQKKEEFSFIDMLKGELPKNLIGSVFQGVSLKYLMTP